MSASRQTSLLQCVSAIGPVGCIGGVGRHFPESRLSPWVRLGMRVQETGPRLRLAGQPAQMHTTVDKGIRPEPSNFFRGIKLEEVMKVATADGLTLDKHSSQVFVRTVQPQRSKSFLRLLSSSCDAGAAVSGSVALLSKFPRLLLDAQIGSTRNRCRLGSDTTGDGLRNSPMRGSQLLLRTRPSEDNLKASDAASDCGGWLA
jgi:hypothetical protein